VASGSADGRSALERMLEARSVAVVGASAREGSVGNQALVELLEGGFEGEIYPVNPKYEDILGLRVFPQLDAIGEPVDLVILGVSNALLEDQLRYAAEIGAGGAVIFASGYEEPREDGGPSLVERLSLVAAEFGSTYRIDPTARTITFVPLPAAASINVPKCSAARS